MPPPATTTTPVKQKPKARIETPGNWTHPRLKEINQRKAKFVFDEQNVKVIAVNVCGLLGVVAVYSFIDPAELSQWYVA
jgi:predicted metal-binding protein